MKVKIAHVLHSVGGVDVYLRLILSNINSNNIDNIIIHGTDDTDIEFRNDKKEVIKSYRTSIFRNISLKSDLKAISFTYKVLKKEKPDLIHCHSAKGGIIGRLLGRLLGINVLYTPHAFSYLSGDSKFKRTLYLNIERFFANGNSKLLATSISEKNNGIDDVKYRRENALLFNNSINSISNITDLTIENTWPDEYLCTVGRPSYQKNIELMVRVIYELKKTRNVHLVIMGVGHHSSNLNDVKKLITELDLHQSITLINWTNQENVHNIISKSKLYISTARYEGLPYSVIEALSLSIPCVVTACDGNKDLIIDGFNGYLIKSTDPQYFSQKIIQLLSDDIIYNELSINALNSFRENYDMKKNAKNLEQIYFQEKTKF